MNFDTLAKADELRRIVIRCNATLLDLSEAKYAGKTTVGISVQVSNQDEWLPVTTLGLIEFIESERRSAVEQLTELGVTEVPDWESGP